MESSHLITTILFFLSIFQPTLPILVNPHPKERNGYPEVGFWKEEEVHRDEESPYFQLEDLPTNVTAHAGEDVHLHCRVEHLGDKTVSWVKRKGQNLELITFGHLTYSSDHRFSLVFVDPNDWMLAIRRSKVGDAGVYECQVSSHPPLSRCTSLAILVPGVEIVDEEGTGIRQRFYRAGTTIELVCRGRTPVPLARILWLHGDTPLNQDTSRGGISVRTETGAGLVQWSRLRLAAATKSDAGPYLCILGGAEATVYLHIISDEYADAMQYGGSEGRSKHVIYLVILIITHYFLFIILY